MKSLHAPIEALPHRLLTTTTTTTTTIKKKQQDNQAVSLVKQQTKLQSKLKLCRTEVAQPSRPMLQQYQQTKCQQKHLYIDQHLQK